MENSEAIPDSATGVQPLTMEDAAALLTDIIQNCSNKLVMFDLDSTLLDNRPRNALIMQQFAQEHRQPLLENATSDHFPTWSARDSMALIGLPDVKIDQLIDPYMRFWEQRFFTSQFCQHDVDIAGAVKFVNAIHETGGVVNYLTGRNETMRKGTMASLEDLGFPLPGQRAVQLIMKPGPGDSDDAFKRDTLQELSASKAIVAGFDNEPTHINFYRQLFPDAVSVHLDTDHSMRDVKLLDGVVSIRDFNY